MFRYSFFIKTRPLGLLVLLSLNLACAGLGSSAWKGDDLELSVVPVKAQFQPGEPVEVHVALTNATGRPANVPGLDHASVSFTVQPQLKGAIGDLKFVKPVFSDKEPTGLTINLAPRASSGGVAQRDFVFTTLTFERGSYVLSAIFTRPSDGPLKPALKTYAKPVLFTVAGDKAFAHRYIDGLIAREDAVKLATEQAGAVVKASDALLIADEAGFQKWWVNLTLEGGQTRSWFVDPYYGKVWKEARPFTTADKGGDPQPAQDAKIIQQLKDQSSRSRER